MNSTNPTRHVIIALALSALLFVIAGDKWNANIRTIQPVKPAAKAS